MSGSQLISTKVSALKRALIVEDDSGRLVLEPLAPGFSSYTIQETAPECAEFGHEVPAPECKCGWGASKTAESLDKHPLVGKWHDHRRVQLDVELSQGVVDDGDYYRGKLQTVVKMWVYHTCSSVDCDDTPAGMAYRKGEQLRPYCRKCLVSRQSDGYIGYTVLKLEEMLGCPVKVSSKPIDETPRILPVSREIKVDKREALLKVLGELEDKARAKKEKVDGRITVLTRKIAERKKLVLRVLAAVCAISLLIAGTLMMPSAAKPDPGPTSSSSGGSGGFGAKTGNANTDSMSPSQADRYAQSHGGVSSSDANGDVSGYYPDPQGCTTLYSSGTVSDSEQTQLPCSSLSQQQWLAAAASGDSKWQAERDAVANAMNAAMGLPNSQSVRDSLNKGFVGTGAQIQNMTQAVDTWIIQVYLKDGDNEACLITLENGATYWPMGACHASAAQAAAPTR